MCLHGWWETGGEQGQLLSENEVGAAQVHHLGVEIRLNGEIAGELEFSGGGDVFNGSLLKTMDDEILTLLPSEIRDAGCYSVSKPFKCVLREMTT